MKRSAYQLALTTEGLLERLQELEKKLEEAERSQEAADIRWASILLETALTSLSKSIGKRVNSSQKRFPPYTRVA